MDDVSADSSQTSLVSGDDVTASAFTTGVMQSPSASSLRLFYILLVFLALHFASLLIGCKTSVRLSIGL